MWQMMGSMFGHKWVSSYGANVDPDRVWQATLSNVSLDKIKNGLKRLSDRGDEWPPSAPEFKKLCLDDGDTWEHKRVKAAMREYKALPKPKNKEVGKKHIEEIRKNLGI